MRAFSFFVACISTGFGANDKAEELRAAPFKLHRCSMPACRAIMAAQAALQLSAQLPPILNVGHGVMEVTPSIFLLGNMQAYAMHDHKMIAQDQQCGGEHGISLRRDLRMLSLVRSWGGLAWHPEGPLALVDYCASVGFGGGAALWETAHEDALAAGCVWILTKKRRLLAPNLPLSVSTKVYGLLVSLMDAESFWEKQGFETLDPDVDHPPDGNNNYNYCYDC